MWIKVDPAQPDELPPSIKAIVKRQAPAAEMLGQHILEIDVDSGAARIAYEASEKLLNRFGALHGGMIASIMDDVMAIAAGLSLAWGELSPTLEMKVNFLAMAKPGRLVALARVVKRGRTVMFLEATLVDAQERMIATASATAVVTQMKRE